MTSNTHISVYARELAGHLREIASTQEIIKDLIASAKDAGINVSGSAQGGPRDDPRTGEARKDLRGRSAALDVPR